MVNLLKDTDAIRDHIAANHPWGKEGLRYFENDFSKFDKSQDRFSYMIMGLIMEKLGFNQQLLDKWLDANEVCSLRSMSLMITLTTMYQNKSGGPATALMNAVCNAAAISTTYAGTKFEWLVLMGDDSLGACEKIVASEQSTTKMMEWFNFEAKFFVLKYPYFTSCFVLLDEESNKVFMVPDPVKRVQKLSVSISGLNPMWEDRFRSINETLVAYRHSKDVALLSEAVRERYGLSDGVDLEPLFSALATLSDDIAVFRNCYEADAEVISY